MALGIRGSNPIWAEFDLQGNIFDDTFYLFVLENTIPYIPATVYHDPDLNVPWTSPIRFLGNGTLPVDIYFESDVVYRLEFRQGPTQSDPLIYEVNNYVAGTGGSTPVDTVAFASSNQVTNPQFALINFEPPITISATDPDPIEIGPGWFLEVAGSGSVTMTQVPLDNANANPSNAPYALQLTLTGWTNDSIFLRQRFQQNGMLWANKFVSSTLTARVEGTPRSVTASLVDSMGSPLATVLTVPAINEEWNQFTGYGELPETTNTDDPPEAYIDYKLSIPNNIDIYVTSIQLVVQELPIEPTFEQDSVERQIDHTFHYYKPQLEFKPIPSMLTGWDFPLNPAQTRGTAVTMTTTAAYIWDQTIAKSVVGNMAVVRNAVTGGFQATTANADEAFYLLQYLTGAQAKKILGNPLSVNLNVFRTQAGGPVTARVYLYRGSAAATVPTLPTTIGTIAASGIFTLTAANWSLIGRTNSQQAEGSLSVVNTADYSTLNDVEDLKFNGWDVTDATQIADTDKFAIVVTYQCPTNASVVVSDSISVVAGEIPTRPAPKTFNETLIGCQYYYRKSFLPGTVPAQNVGLSTGEAVFVQIAAATTAGFGPIVVFPTPMRATPNVTLYNPSATNAQIRNTAIAFDWSASAVTGQSANGFHTTGTTPGGSASANGSAVHWTANAQLGVV